MRLQRARLRVHGGLPQLVGVHLAQALEAGDVHLGVGVVRRASPRDDAVPLGVGIGHAGGLAARQLVQRRHGGVDIAVLDQRAHIAEEEGEQQRPYMATVHVGIRHDDYLVVSELGDVEVLAYARRRAP